MRLHRALKHPGRHPLVAYFPLGDPAIAKDLDIVYTEGGVDVFEIGLPTDRATLDGPIVSASMRRALDEGVDLSQASNLTAAMRKEWPEQAMVWMAYPAIAEMPGFARQAEESGVDGIVVPAPMGELSTLREELRRCGIKLVQFLGWSAPQEEIDLVRMSEGYVMVQSAPLTGARPWPEPAVGSYLNRIRTTGGTVPLLVGFGISTPAQAAEAIRAGADGIVVGSAMIRAALQGMNRVGSLLRSIRTALDAC
jgi:tryptophan synthase alpha chain